MIRSVPSGRCGPCSLAPAPTGSTTSGSARRTGSASSQVRSARYAPRGVPGRPGHGAPRGVNTTSPRDDLPPSTGHPRLLQEDPAPGERLLVPVELRGERLDVELR